MKQPSEDYIIIVLGLEAEGNNSAHISHIQSSLIYLFYTSEGKVNKSQKHVVLFVIK